METNMKYDLLPLEEGDEDYIGSKLEENAESIVPAEPDAKEENVVLKITDDDGNVIAGSVFAVDNWKIAFLHVLWVDERYRRQGLASALIRESERIARNKKCYLVVLGSFDFQARPLYEKHGYMLYGVVEDWPRGHCNYALGKRLDRPSPEYIPSNPQKESKYEVEVGNEDDIKVICAGIDAHNQAHVPDERESDALGKRISDENGGLIAAYTASIDGWNAAYFDAVWVEEPYRNQGIGSQLLQDAERELKEKGAYVMLLWCYDWEAEFFIKRGFTVCTACEDNPKGHCYYCMKKLL